MRQWGRRSRTEFRCGGPVVAGGRQEVVTATSAIQWGQICPPGSRPGPDVLAGELHIFRPVTLGAWGSARNALWEIHPGSGHPLVTRFGQKRGPSAAAGFGSIGDAMGGIST